MPLTLLPSAEHSINQEGKDMNFAERQQPTNPPPQPDPDHDTNQPDEDTNTTKKKAS